MSYRVGQIIDEYGTIFTTQMWSVEKILRTVTASADFDGWGTEEFDGTPSMWAHVIASKGGDEQTPALAQKILDEGFTKPICIYRTSTGAYGIGNGHHRLVCAILLGLDEIPVLYTDTSEYYPNASDGPDIVGTDEEFSDMIYELWSETYKTLSLAEFHAESEDW